jgi:hypothetical protein
VKVALVKYYFGRTRKFDNLGQSSIISRANHCANKSYTVECAEQILTVVPIVVRELWNRLQAETPMAVTLAQFGLLSFLYRCRLDLTGPARE